MEMTITTKFNIGQKVVAFDSTTLKLKDFEISEIHFYADLKKTSTWYRDGKTRDIFKEADIFVSREEFINQL